MCYFDFFIGVVVENADLEIIANSDDPLLPRKESCRPNGLLAS